MHPKLDVDIKENEIEIWHLSMDNRVFIFVENGQVPVLLYMHYFLNLFYMQYSAINY